MGGGVLGFQFLPKREELVNFYLLKMLKKEALPPICCNLFTNLDVYGSHPCMLFDANDYTKSSEEMIEESDGMEKRIRYFFTPLKSFIKKDGKNGKRIKRKAGSGFWKEEFSDDIKLQGGGGGDNVIGQEKYFKYKNNGGGGGGQGKEEDDSCVEWRMHEYTLVGNKDMAISRITKVIRKKRGRSTPCRIKIVYPPLVIQQQQQQEQVIMSNNLGFNQEEEFSNDGQCLTIQETYNNNVNNNVSDHNGLCMSMGMLDFQSEDHQVQVDNANPPSTICEEEWSVEDVMGMLDFQSEDHQVDNATSPSTICEVEWTDEDVMELFDFNNK